jgi:hypothetical protein
MAAYRPAQGAQVADEAVRGKQHCGIADATYRAPAQRHAIDCAVGFIVRDARICPVRKFKGRVCALRPWERPGACLFLSLSTSSLAFNAKVVNFLTACQLPHPSVQCQSPFGKDAPVPYP